MSRLSGVALVLTGLGIAAYAVNFSGTGSTVAADPNQDAMTVAVAEDAGVAASGPDLGRGFASDPREPANANFQVPVPVPATRPASWTPSVTAAVPPRRIPLAQSDDGARAPLDRAGLAREIQRHLKRVGCYAGDVTGAWTPAARRSMKSFTDRVNASLPIDDPDYVLLAMVESYQGKACGRGCPAGESEADDGRCLPKGLLAQAPRKGPGAEASTHAKGNTVAAMPLPGAADVVPAPPPQGRMALAGPPVAEIPTAETRKGDSPDKRRSEPGDNRRYSDARNRGRPARGMNRLPNWAAAAFGNSP